MTAALWRIATPMEQEPSTPSRVLPVHATRSESRSITDRPLVQIAAEVSGEPMIAIAISCCVRTQLCCCGTSKSTLVVQQKGTRRANALSGTRSNCTTSFSSWPTRGYGSSLLCRDGDFYFGSPAPSRRYFLTVLRDNPVRPEISRIGILSRNAQRRMTLKKAHVDHSISPRIKSSGQRVHLGQFSVIFRGVQGHFSAEINTPAL